ncbi:MAG: protease HtpX [Bdellovibrionales bacterium]|jgi:heat shock protein HtpX|nr:protease HtpX [Bdellovibrionales bacterium]
MQMVKRIALFLMVNILVMATLSIIINVFGLGPMMTDKGYNIPTLLVFCGVWGMGGAFISLLLSKVMAKWSMGVKIINPQTHDTRERELVDMVYRYARSAGLNKMPEVGIYESPEVNAFATGPSKSNSLVAVSSGLLQTMDKRSVEGVVAHEVAHIANGDMVTMTLIQGVVNAFVMALARLVAFAISNALRSDDDRGPGLGPIAHMVTVIVLEIVFMFLGSIVVMWFSRQREFRADKGGAQYAGRDAMISALKSLQSMSERNYQVTEQTEAKPAFASMKISSGKRPGGLADLLRTHPTLEDRIARLERGGV